MTLETIKETFGAYQEVCTKVKKILQQKLEEEVKEILDAKFVVFREIPFIAVMYMGLTPNVMSLYSKHELIPAVWLEDGFNWRQAKWPITDIDTQEVAIGMFCMTED